MKTLILILQVYTDVYYINVPAFGPEIIVASFQSLYETLEHTAQDMNATEGIRTQTEQSS